VLATHGGTVLKKRLSLILAAGALMAAMLPGVASSAFPSSPFPTLEACGVTNPSVAQLSECVATTRAELKDLYAEMDQTAKEIQKKLKKMSKDEGAVSAVEIQALISELAGVSLVSHTAILSMARNVKS